MSITTTSVSVTKRRGRTPTRLKSVFSTAWNRPTALHVVTVLFRGESEEGDDVISQALFWRTSNDAAESLTSIIEEAKSAKSHLEIVDILYGNTLTGETKRFRYLEGAVSEY
ncbi:hypothetical protein ACIPLR_27185 [Herbaspirillum huttiense]|jgi:hypothetical protein|uniref:hypothetical protein n=1 Tax=Herbaspirillum TaxID=963 RepID=UPI0012DE0620|nr:MULTISPECIES: hypothetical protein [Herbaspirillum]